MPRLQPTTLANLTQRNLNRWDERIARYATANYPRGITLQGISPGTANVAFTVQHGMNRLPVTIDGQHTNNGGVVYVVSWNQTSATFKCTTASATYTVVLM